MERESDLYPPLKALFEGLGYTVKGEVGAADLMAVRGDDPVVIVELKLSFSLTLFHQAVARLSVTDEVYLAVARPTGKVARRRLRDNLGLCRRLGLGLITVRKDGNCEVHCDPGPFAPRKSKKRQAQLRREFHSRQGDPNAGGATRHGLVTSYRQDAIRVASYLAESGAEKGSIVAKATGVKRATTVMRDNHYGWFAKVEKGVYVLTPEGKKGLGDWAHSVD